VFPICPTFSTTLLTLGLASATKPSAKVPADRRALPLPPCKNPLTVDTPFAILYVKKLMALIIYILYNITKK
jgi:hypothetical protein